MSEPIDKMTQYQVELEIGRLQQRELTVGEAKRLNELYTARNMFRRLGR